MPKVWYRSTTLWALAVSAIAHLLTIAGFTDEESRHLAAELVATLVPFVGILADLAAAWGRRRARGPLTLTTDDSRL
jgi:hypothetical protein